MTQQATNLSATNRDCPSSATPGETRRNRLGTDRYRASESWAEPMPCALNSTAKKVLWYAGGADKVGTLHDYALGGL